jgi:acyl dehydratase
MQPSADVHERGDAPFLTRGLAWDELPTGFRFRTSSRTVTETDLVTFVNWAGITEPLFQVDTASEAAGYKGRLVPGMVAYCFAEGLIVQTGAHHNTGMAFLGAELRQKGPVYVGDTVEAVVEVLESRTSRTPGRGVVTTRVQVRNQRAEIVLEYDIVRYMRGLDDPEMVAMIEGTHDMKGAVR